MTRHLLGSASGVALGSYFFLAVSGAIAFAIYTLMTRRSSRRRELVLGTVRATVAMPVALLVWTALFSAIYFSTLAGFHAIGVSETEVQVEYAIPRRTLRRSLVDVVGVSQRPSYKGLWRLEISLAGGRRLESLPASRRSVQEAAVDIEHGRRQNRGLR